MGQRENKHSHHESDIKSINPLKLHFMGGNYIGQCSKTLRPPFYVSTFSQLMDYHDKPQYIG